MNALIIPVYKNENSIKELVSGVKNINGGLSEGMTAVFVVDGSPDNSSGLLEKLLPTAGFKSKLVEHSRNFGSFEAIRTGMKEIEADKYAVMAADLQEPPELIIDFFKNLKYNEKDIVFGIRENRKDPFVSKIFSAIFWKFYRRFIIKEIPPGGVDVFGCVRQVRDRIVSFTEANSSLVAQLFWVGFKRSYIRYERRKRERGKSAWTFRKKFNYLMDSVFSVTDLPIKFLIALGTAGIVLSVGLGFTVFISRLAGLIEVSGYTALMLTIIFFGTANILGVGIAGAYAHRSYENTKGRPQAITVYSKEFNGGEK